MFMRYLILILLLSSCGYEKKMAEQKALDSWIGSTENALVIQWGPPNRTDPDGNGGKILTFSTRKAFASSSINYDFTDNTHMYVNKDGKIYGWKTGRVQNLPQQVIIR